MELKIFWTDFAKKELRGIFNYYLEKAGLVIARKLTVGIVEETSKLKALPFLGQKELLLDDKPQEFRYLVYKNYKIIYWFNKDKDQIEINDVFDTRQNPILLKRNK